MARRVHGVGCARLFSSETGIGACSATRRALTRAAMRSTTYTQSPRAVRTHQGTCARSVRRAMHGRPRLSRGANGEGGRNLWGRPAPDTVALAAHAWAQVLNKRDRSEAMGRRGPKKTPAQITELKGNPGRRSADERTVKVPDGEIVMPRWLTDLRPPDDYESRTVAELRPIAQALGVTRIGRMTTGSPRACRHGVGVRVSGRRGKRAALGRR